MRINTSKKKDGNEIPADSLNCYYLDIVSVLKAGKKKNQFLFLNLLFSQFDSLTSGPILHIITRHGVIRTQRRKGEIAVNRTRKLISTALMVSLTAVGAQIVIPIGSVPVTMQIFMVFLSGMILGPVWGGMAQIVYLLLGLFGLPVFAMLTSGPGILAGPTGGFLLAFPAVAFLTGFEKSKQVILFRITALFLLYTFGWIRLALFTGSGLTALITGVLPFIGFDCLKLWAAAFVYQQLKRRLLSVG